MHKCAAIITPSKGQGITGRLLKFARYINNHNILTGNIFRLILKKQDGRQGCFFLVMKSAYISLLLVLEVYNVNQPIGNHWLGIFRCGQI